VMGDRFRFGATFFRNDVTNLIDTGLAAPGVFTSVNIGAATMYGVEAFANWKVTKTLNLRADYTNTTAKDNSTGEELLRRPKNKASITAAWQVDDKLSLSGTVLYVGSWMDIDRSGFTTGLTAAPFTTVNIAANYAASENVNYFVRIDNLFNKQYEDPIGFLRPGLAVYGGIRLTGLPTSADGGFGGFVPSFLKGGSASPM
jgi:vitamin B12 transporter